MHTPLPSSLWEHMLVSVLELAVLLVPVCGCWLNALCHVLHACSVNVFAAGRTSACSQR